MAFVVHPSGVPERMHGDPAEVAVENALRKALAVRAARAGADPPELILGVDTLVTLDGELYGKPRDVAHARATLRALGGRTHRVLSGLALLHGERRLTAVACTEVEFRELDEALLDWYLARGEWRERAGGYAIQGAGAALVRGLRGDYENVVGLPLAQLLELVPKLLAACK